MPNDVDVAIVGGGPAGSTAGALLRKYAPHLTVAIYERETFPRDHVGESQLPPIGKILDEMGVWEKVEAAGFPIKVGGTYRWGTTDDLWDVDFIKEGLLEGLSRPSRFDGIRRLTAFQVDRARFDKILLDHARTMGCEVYEGTSVREVGREGDRVVSLSLANGETVRPRYVVDASGGAGLLRRAMDVGVDSPTSLRNIAIWRYWENAEWAVKIGVGGTRVYVVSLGYGWIWFIPLGPTRTSVGLIVPASYYKDSGERPEALYDRAMGEDPLIASLLKSATPEPELLTTKDWSFVAERTAGENWFLAGESAGFADPILATGMTLAHQGAREAAYTIVALEEGREDADWLRRSYDENQRSRLAVHIRFADYWYSANAQFTDLKEFTRGIAKDAGLDLDPDAAFQWLGSGGFTSEYLGATGIGTYDIRGIKLLTERLSDHMAEWRIDGRNRFVLDLDGAERTVVADYREGKINPVDTYLREGKKLPVYGVHRGLIEALQKGAAWEDLEANLERIRANSAFRVYSPGQWRSLALQSLEAMVVDGWVRAETVAGQASVTMRVDPLPTHR